MTLRFFVFPTTPLAKQPASVVNPKVRLIDASSAHRTDPLWVYGLPEMDCEQADRIRVARRVSNPGCYPTGAIALLKPLISARLSARRLPGNDTRDFGYSGRGRSGVEEHEGPASGNALPFQVYGLGLQHKHVPEIQRYSGLARPPLFVPSYGSYRQGIVLSIPIHGHMLAANSSGDTLRTCLENHYSNSSLISVVDSSTSASLQGLDPQLLNGSNKISLAVFSNDRNRQVLLTAIFDNLGKGASGAAVQNSGLDAQYTPRVVTSKRNKQRKQAAEKSVERRKTAFDHCDGDTDSRDAIRRGSEIHSQVSLRQVHE